MFLTNSVFCIEHGKLSTHCMVVPVIDSVGDEYSVNLAPDIPISAGIPPLYFILIPTLWFCVNVPLKYRVLSVPAPTGTAIPEFT